MPSESVEGASVSHSEEKSRPQATQEPADAPLFPKNLFGSSKVYGRQSERELLLQKWQKCCTDQQQELVLISSLPGNGTSSLVHSLRPYIKREKRRKQFFLFAKFSGSNQSRPYDVFVSAFTNYINQLLNSGDNALITECKQRIQELSAAELDVVIQLIPALEQLSDARAKRRRSSNSSSKDGSGTLQVQVHGSNTANRLRNAFSHLVEKLCECTPILLCLDDLQWCNSSNMELLRNCLIESNRKIAIMVIATIRSDVIEESKSARREGLRASLHDSGGRATASQACLDLIRSKQPNVTSIELSDLAVDDFNEILMDTLKEKSPSLLELSRLAYARTKGNAFHLMQLLRFLVEKGVVVNVNNRWEWDDKDVKDMVNSSGSISELVSDTITSLPRPVQEAMKVSSCLGSEIDCSAVDRVLQTPSAGLLQKAAAHGLLEFDSMTGGYCFSHDLIRQSAYELIPEDKKEAFLLNVGQRLWRSASASALEENIIFIVSVINKGSSLLTEERERYKVAELNLKAGLKAKAIPSFADAGVFFQRGIQLLGPTSWEDRYVLSLQLYGNAADTETVNSNHAAAASYINEVVQHGATLDDKLLAYSALARCMLEQDNMDKATDVCIDVLHQLGEPFPSRFSKLKVANELIRVKIALRGKTDDALLNLPRMMDDRKKRCMPFLLYGFFSSSLAKSPLAAVFAFRMVSMSVKYGLHETSSAGFGAYAMTLGALQYDPKEVFRFGQIALKMAEELNAPQHLTYVYMIVGSSTMHGVRPIHESIETLRYAGTVGIETGVVTSAITARLLECIYMFNAGRRLSKVERNAKEALKLAHLYHQRQFGAGLALILQMIHCYDGKSDNPCVPTGIHLNFDESLREVKASNDQMTITFHHVTSMQLAYVHGDLAIVEGCLEALKGNSNYSPLFSTKVNHFDRALAALALCREGKDHSQNLKYAKSQYKGISKAAKQYPSNFLHFKLLLEAEIMYVSGAHPKNVCSLYQNAIEEAREQDDKRIMAITTERLADYKSEKGQIEDAREKWKQAADLYQRWGAVAKARMLKQMLERPMKQKK